MRNAAAAIYQAVVEEVKTGVSQSMLDSNNDGRNDPERARRIQQMKKNTACKACGKRGHLWTDNAVCKDRFYKKRRSMDRPDRLSGTDDAVAIYDPPPQARDSQSVFPPGAR